MLFFRLSFSFSVKASTNEIGYLECIVDHLFNCPRVVRARQNHCDEPGSKGDPRLSWADHWTWIHLSPRHR